MKENERKYIIGEVGKGELKATVREGKSSKRREKKRGQRPNEREK